MAKFYPPGRGKQVFGALTNSDEIPFCLALAIISMCFMATLRSLSVMRDGISTCEAKEKFPISSAKKTHLCYDKDRLTIQEQNLTLTKK